MEDKEKKKLAGLLKEGEAVENSPSFTTDFEGWKKKAMAFIEKHADEKTKEKAAKIAEKDALYMYLWETDRDDLEKQSVSHQKWQMGQLMEMLHYLDKL